MGFQGLFFIRLDGLNTDPALVASSYQFDAGGTILSRTWRGWFYARNRLYEPVLGRFTSKDPHVTGLPVNDSFAFDGRPSHVSVDGFDGPMHYGDGLSLYGFVGSNPVNNNDPSGLFFGGFANVLSSTAVQGSLRALEAGSAVAAGLDMYSAIMSGVGWRNAMYDLVIAAAADRLGGKLFDKALDVANAAFQAMRRSVAKGGIGKLGAEAAERGFHDAAGCFPAGTLVAVSDIGWMPIEMLQVGDIVLDAEPSDGGSLVVSTFKTDETVYRDFVILSTKLQLLPMQATSEHPFWVVGRGWVRAADLRPGDLLTDSCGVSHDILSIETLHSNAPVYNIQVYGATEYYVSESRIRVHNKPLRIGWVNGPKPQWRPNVKHHQNAQGKASREPSDSRAAFENAIQDVNGNWYGLSSRGEIYRYAHSRSNEAHWSGSTDTGLEWHNIPIDVRRYLLNGEQ